MVEYRFLGPVEVVHEGRQVSLGGRQRKTILSLLAIRPNSIVTADSLVDALWSAELPTAARRSMQAHVAHLKKAVNVEDEVLLSVDSGYRLEVGEQDTDIQSFENKVAKGRELLGDDPRAAKESFDAALALWRGQPFGGAAGDVAPLHDESLRLNEVRLGCIEDRYEAALEADDATTLVPELQRLTRQHPIRERLVATYMLALYRSGRQAEALRAFDDVRRTLATEVGIEPSPELDELAQQIRDQDPVLGRVARTRPSTDRFRGSRRWIWVATIAMALATAGVILAIRAGGDPSLSAPPIAAPGSGHVIAGLTFNELTGGGWSPETELELSVDGSNGIQVRVPSNGEWRTPLDALGIKLASGSEIEVRVDGEVVRSMTAADLTFERIDLPGHVIEGTTDAPEGSPLTVWVIEPGRTLEYVDHVSDGRWRVEPVDPVGSRFDLVVALQAFGGQSDFGYLSEWGDPSRP